MSNTTQSQKQSFTEEAIDDYGLAELGGAGLLRAIEGCNPPDVPEEWIREDAANVQAIMRQVRRRERP